MNRNNESSLRTAGGIARLLLTIGAAVLLASCGPPVERGVPVRIDLGRDPIGLMHGVPVRIVVIEPVDIGSGEQANVTITLIGDAHMLGQSVAVFYEGDRDLLVGIPSSPTEADNHLVKFNADSVTFPIQAAKTNDAGTVVIRAKSYGTTGFESASVTVNGGKKLTP